MKKLIAAVCLAAIALPGAALAETSYYASAGYAGTRVSHLDANIGAIQGVLGAKFGKYVGAELELAAGVKEDTIDVIGVPVKIKLKSEASIFAVGYLPLSENFDLLARVGYGNTQYDVSAAGAGLSSSDQSTDYGVGAIYTFDKLNGVRVDYTRYAISHAATDSFAIAYIRKF